MTGVGYINKDCVQKRNCKDNVGFSKKVGPEIEPGGNLITQKLIGTIVGNKNNTGNINKEIQNTNDNLNNKYDGASCYPGEFTNEKGEKENCKE